MDTTSLLFDWTKAANCAAYPDTASVVVTLDIVGMTVVGTVYVRLHVLVPVNTPPKYVSQVIVQEPLVALGICVAYESGGVHDMDAPTACAVPIVPLLPPKEYLIVCW